MKIHCFASIAELTGTPVLELTGISTTGELKGYLNQKYPPLSNLSFAISVNRQVVNDANFPLRDEDEVGLLPPFSGG